MKKLTNDTNTRFYARLFSQQLGEKVEAEYRFHPKRRWLIDLAIPARKLAIEIEGGVYTGGRHTHPTGFMKDMEKYNSLALCGWRLLRFTPKQIKRETNRVLALIEAALCLKPT